MSGENMAQTDSMEKLLDEIRISLKKARERRTGFCTYTVFRAVYNILKSEEQPCYLMLYTAETKNGSWEELSNCLQKAVRDSLPSWGVACMYGEGQCLLLLTDFSGEDCEELARKIDGHFLSLCPEASVHYSMKRAIPA